MRDSLRVREIKILLNTADGDCHTCSGWESLGRYLIPFLKSAFKREKFELTFFWTKKIQGNTSLNPQQQQQNWYFSHLIIRLPVNHYNRLRLFPWNQVRAMNCESSENLARVFENLINLGQVTWFNQVSFERVHHLKWHLVVCVCVYYLIKEVYRRLERWKKKNK